MDTKLRIALMVLIVAILTCMEFYHSVTFNLTSCHFNMLACL
jgi:hypothetical protein